MLIDTHCHLDFNAYDADRAEVLERASSRGVTRLINPAIDSETGEAILRLAESFPGVYAAVGFHPNSTATYQTSHLARIEAQARHPKVVAIGEIGLDYYREHSPREQQRRAFEDQLTLAARLGLPVIIHNREASADVLAILTRWVSTLPDGLKERPGALHSFSGSQADAQRALSLGFYLGFTGPITYKKADDLRAIARSVPLERILVETDGPFLTPQQHRGQRNEPAYVEYVAERLANLHAISNEAMQAATTQNAERLFGLPGVEQSG